MHSTKKTHIDILYPPIKGKKLKHYWDEDEIREKFYRCESKPCNTCPQQCPVTDYYGEHKDGTRVVWEIMSSSDLPGSIKQLEETVKKLIQSKNHVDYVAIILNSISRQDQKEYIIRNKKLYMRKLHGGVVMVQRLEVWAFYKKDLARSR